MNRCTGHCCRSFCLPDFAAEYLKTACFLESHGLIPGWGSAVNPDYDYQEELLTIADMVIPLGRKTMAEACEIVGSAKAKHIEIGDDESTMRYTCRHLSPTGDCTIYDRRPDMCKRYPSMGKCEWAACTKSVSISPEECEEVLAEVKEFSV